MTISSQPSARALPRRSGTVQLRSIGPDTDVSELASSTPQPHIRVLHVLEAVAGGTLRHLVNVLQTIPNVEHHVVFPPDLADLSPDQLSANAMAVQEMLDSGATIHRIDMLRNPLHPKNVTGLLRLRRLVRRLEPTLVHGHSSVGGAFARAAVWGTSVPDIYTPHGLLTSRAVLMVEKILAHRTSRFVAVSPSEGARALQIGLTSKERLVVIPNGVDLEPQLPSTYDLRKELGLHADVTLVGTVSRLAHQKAPSDFVRICAQVGEAQPDVHFVLIGAGDLQPELDAAVTAAGLNDRFHQIDFLRWAPLAISQMDVFVLSSRFEGAAYAPLEAMQAGVPVVMTDVTGNKDTVENGISGLLFPFGDVHGMSEGVLRLLTDFTVRDSVVEAALERVRTHFDRLQSGASLEALYREIAAKRA